MCTIDDSIDIKDSVISMNATLARYSDAMMVHLIVFQMVPCLEKHLDDKMRDVMVSM